MLDKKTTTVLRTLGKLSGENAYKVITVEEILASLPAKAYDLDSVKQTIDFLNKQEYIVIKFEEDYTFCYSLLPKARIYLEQDIVKPKNKQKKFEIMHYIYVMIASFIGAMLAMLVFFYLTF